MKDIGTPMVKVDAYDKTTGKSLYVNDIVFPGILHAKTVRSKHAKATIVSRKYPELPEGYFIVDYKDIPGKNYIKIIFEDWKIFAENEVTYYLEPIALLLGPDKEVVQQLVNQVEIEYKVETPEFEFNDSVIHYHFNKGDIEKAKKESDQVISITYDTPYQEQLYIEPQGMIGYFEENQVTLVGSIQCPYYVKNAVINILECDEDYIRVKQATVGGAFGGKEEFPSLLACQLAVAIDKYKVPISLIYEREEDMETTTKRHPATLKMTGYVKNNIITGLCATVGIDAGAYIGLSGVVLSRALIASTGAYTIDNLEVDGDVYRTNSVPNGAYRGFGAPQMFFAIEMFVHHIAKEIDVDPLQLRKDMLAVQNDKTSTNGTFRDPIIMPDMLEKALKESDYIRKVKEYDQDDSYRGIGMSWFLHGCGFTGSGEATHIKALVELEKNEEDKVAILIAAVDMGQGIRTSMRKLVSTILEIPIEDVIYDLPDTNKVPDSGPTVASRTMMIVGGLIARAARKMKESWKQGEYLKTSERFKQPEYIKWNEETFQGDAYPAYSWGINIVEVEIDKRSYEVTIKEEWSVYDVGKAIDEQIIMGQADGGQLQGLGYGYLEKMSHKNGKIQHKNVTDYIIPTTVDTPVMHNYIMDNPYPLGPYGAKGAGELTLVGGAPAVALAIENAIGKKVTKIPVSPEYIMELMKDE